MLWDVHKDNSLFGFSYLKIAEFIKTNVKTFIVTINKYSETLEFSSLLEPNPIKHEFAESELFQFIDVFFEFNSVLLHLNDFYEFSSIVPNSKKQ
jgi:hypothetical protein